MKGKTSHIHTLGIVKGPIVAKVVIGCNPNHIISVTFFPQKYRTNPKMR